MEKTYVRPADLVSAIKIFSPNSTVPVYGYYAEPLAMEGITILDLQDCGLDTINKVENTLVIGASASLQTVLEHPDCPSALRTAISIEDQLNRRNMLTLIDAINQADGTSPVAAVLLALDVKLNLATESPISLVDYLPFKEAKLFVSIELPLGCSCAYKYINATPADRPLVSATLSKWESGRIRLVLGGTGKSPVMVVDGKGSLGIEKAAESAYLDAGDFKASKEYRASMAKLLTLRCLSEIDHVL